MPQEIKTKCVVWDLDDTLIDTYSDIIPLSHRAAAAAMVDAGLNAHIEEVYEARIKLSGERAGGQDLDASVSLSFGGSDFHADAGRRAFLETDVGFVTAKPSVRLMLSRLSNHCDLALITQGCTKRQTMKILHAELSEYFSFISVLNPSSIIRKKDVIKSLVAVYGNSNSVAVVGDRPDEEILAAAELSLFCIRVLKGEWKLLNLGYAPKQLELIDHVEEAEQILMQRFL